MKNAAIIKCTIEKMVHGGLSLARTDQGVVFVDGGLPGETVEVQITGAFGRSPCGVVENILEQSPLRRVPFCPFALTCGGCNWQHIHGREQAQLKLQIWQDCLGRIGKINNLPEPQIISGPETGYRHRVQFKIDQAAGATGFFARKSCTVVPIDFCPVLVDELNAFLGHIAANPPQTDVVKAIAGTSGVASSPVVEPYSYNYTTLSVGDITFDINGSGFFQQNRHLLFQLGSWARPLLRGGTAIDLFGGSGFFSLCTADQFENLLLVESDPALTAQARIHFDRHGHPQFKVRTVTTEGFFGSVPRQFQNPDCVIIDPPRTGLSSTVRSSLSALKPFQILSVSCDPATQARDCGYFVNTCGYRITHAALFDLYPNTHHMETLLLLERQTIA